MPSEGRSIGYKGSTATFACRRLPALLDGIGSAGKV